MSWSSFNPAGWTAGVTIPQVSDYQGIYNDLRTRGGPVDGGGYGRANTSYLILTPGELPGTQHTVTAATWSAGVATLTIGGHSIGVNQRITLSGASPSGWNTTTDSVKVTAVTSTQISFSLGANPGTWTSGGTVLVDGVTPALGMVAVDPNLNYQIWNGSAWVAALTVTSIPQWHEGSGAPSSGLGSNGDMYLDATAGNVYGPKTAGSWGSPAGSLIGPQGANVLWDVGSGAPSSGVGNNGDIYLDYATGNVYGPKSGGAWGSILCNLKGPTGSAGTGYSFAYQSVTTNTTLTNSATEQLIEVNASSGPVTITLFSASGNSGYKVTVVKTDSSANTVTIAGTINGVTNKLINSQDYAYTSQSNGTAWRLV